MRGKNRFCWASLPKRMITGPTILSPNGSSRGAPAAALSSSKMYCCTGSHPVPPNCFGQLGAPHPCRCRICCQRIVSSRETSRPSSTFRRASWGRFASMKARTSSRKASSSLEKFRSIVSRPPCPPLFRDAKLCFVPRVRRNTVKSGLASAPDRKFVTALGRGLDVLRCFGPRDRWLANQEIAARTGLARPTVSRLVYTLTQLGFLRHAHSPPKYALGGAAVSLGYSALTQIDIRRAARPLLHALSQQTNASVHLAINDGLHMQVIDTYWHSSAFVIDIGSRVPVVTTSLGRAYVCAFPDYEQYGFCLALGDWRRDVNAVAAPFDPRDGTKPVVVGCSGAAFQLGPDLLKRDIGPRLLALIGNLRSSLRSD